MEQFVISFFEIYRVIMLIFYFIIDLSLAIPFLLLHFATPLSPRTPPSHDNCRT